MDHPAAWQEAKVLGAANIVTEVPLGGVKLAHHVLGGSTPKLPDEVHYAWAFRIARRRLQLLTALRLGLRPPSTRRRRNPDPNYRRRAPRDGVSITSRRSSAWGGGGACRSNCTDDPTMNGQPSFAHTNSYAGADHALHRTSTGGATVKRDRSSLGFALSLHVHVPRYEVDRRVFDDYYEGGRTLRRQAERRGHAAAGLARARSRHGWDSRTPDRAPSRPPVLVQEDASIGTIPFGSSRRRRPCIWGSIRLTVTRWNVQEPPRRSGIDLEAGVSAPPRHGAAFLSDVDEIRAWPRSASSGHRGSDGGEDEPHQVRLPGDAELRVGLLDQPPYRALRPEGFLGNLAHRAAGGQRRGDLALGVKRKVIPTKSASHLVGFPDGRSTRARRRSGRRSPTDGQRRE